MPATVRGQQRLGQVFELIADYQLARENLPEAQADLQEERAHEERAEQWTSEIIKYARQWSKRRDRLERGEAVTEPEPKLPEPVPTCEMWSDEKIQTECDRIIQTPSRRDRLEAFAGFVSGQCYSPEHWFRRVGHILLESLNHVLPIRIPAGQPHQSRGGVPGRIPASQQLENGFQIIAAPCQERLMDPLNLSLGLIVPVTVVPEELAELDLRYGQHRRHLNRAGESVGHYHEVGETNFPFHAPNLQPVLCEIPIWIQRPLLLQTAARSIQLGAFGRVQPREVVRVQAFNAGLLGPEQDLLQRGPLDLGS